MTKKNCKKVEFNKNVIWSRVDNEIVVLDVETNNYYSLNTIGAAIWEMCKTAVTTDEIVSNICAEYEADEAHVRKDIEEIIKELEKEGLVQTFN